MLVLPFFLLCFFGLFALVVGAHCMVDVLRELRRVGFVFFSDPAFAVVVGPEVQRFVCPPSLVAPIGV
jgi:3-oxoacyl-[acyl-carrier-protein] synthase III